MIQNHRPTTSLQSLTWHSVAITCSQCSVFHNMNQQDAPVEIGQNVTSPFMTTCDLQSFVTKFGNIATTRPNFNYFGHFHNYDATIRNFILLVGLILHLFSSINRLIYPISCNSHQISYILKVFYIDIGVYFNICTKIIYNIHTYAYYLYNESQN